MVEAQPDAGILPQTDRAFGACRRKGRLFDRANLVAPDLRRQWHHRGLHRRGFKDGDSGGGLGQISFRLVEGQEPGKIRKAFRDYVTARLPKDCKAEFGDHSSAPAIALGLEHESRSLPPSAPLTEEWGKETVLMGSGASIPIVADFKRTLGLDTVLVGFGLDDDNIHSPNEKYDLRVSTRAFVRGANSRRAGRRTALNRYIAYGGQRRSLRRATI